MLKDYYAIAPKAQQKLAKDNGEQPAAAHLASAPTKPTPLIGEGMIVGPLHYMAAGQLEGKPANARTVRWAMGRSSTRC